MKPREQELIAETQGRCAVRRAFRFLCLSILRFGLLVLLLLSLLIVDVIIYIFMRSCVL